MFKAVPGIVDSLSDPRLLLPERYEELVNHLLPQCSEWSIMGRELIHRGWLTPYQMREVSRGNAASLILAVTPSSNRWARAGWAACSWRETGGSARPSP